MGYTDSLLADGEVVVRRARQHWLALVPEARRAWLLLLIGIVALVAGLYVANGAAPWPTIGSGLSLVALAALLIGIVDAAYHVARWRAQDYVVTNRRVVLVEGILNKRAADSSLEKINDAILTQGVLGRILGFGDLDILTASESAIDHFRIIAQASAFKREMLNQKHALELEVGRVPAAPFRADGAAGSRGQENGRGWRPANGAGGARAEGSASMPGSASVASPVPALPGAGQPASASPAPWSRGVPGAVPAAAGDLAAPAGPAAGTAESGPAARFHGPLADPEQVTATLARLADLRDRGAITPEEFEAKKAELLARL